MSAVTALPLKKKSVRKDMKYDFNILIQILFLPGSKQTGDSGWCWQWNQSLGFKTGLFQPIGDVTPSIKSDHRSTISFIAAFLRNIDIKKTFSHHVFVHLCCFVFNGDQAFVFSASQQRSPTRTVGFIVRWQRITQCCAVSLCSVSCSSPLCHTQ